MENSNNNKPNKNLFLKFLPKAATAVSFQNPQFSPGRDHHHHHHNHHHHHHHHHNSGKVKAHAHKGFSGPINFSVLPEEARGRPKNNGSYEAHEPTSPKVSCMGQIKHKHKQMKKLSKIVSNKNNDNNNNVCISSNKTNSEGLNKKRSSSISKFFNRSKKPGKKSSKGQHSSSSDDDHGKNGGIAALDQKISSIPSLGQMNKFASGRESSLANFDWTAQIAPLDHDREYYSDDEEQRRDHSDDDDDDGEVIIPYSAPILMVGGRSSLSRGGDDQDDDMMRDLEPRKEVNLWKRRTMAPPPPLALNS